jgi:thiol-disulfide isomerase/thioredoxin
VLLGLLLGVVILSFPAAFQAGSITAPTGAAELIETGGAGASFAMTEADYRKMAEQLASMAAFVPMTKRPDGLSPQARFGLNFVFEGHNLSWALDGDDRTGYTFYADLNANGDLSDDPPHRFELVNGKYSLYLELMAKVKDGGERYPVVMKLVIDRIARPGAAAKQLALLNFSATRRQGELELEAGATPLRFSITGSNGVYNEDYNSISFDLNHDGTFDPEVERYLVSEKYVNIGDASYEFAVDSYGRSVTLTRLAGKRPARVILMPGYPAPDFAFVDLRGDGRRLADYRGKVVLLDFWGTWCGPCVASVPQLVEVYQKFHSKGFEILGIVTGDTREKLTAFTTEKDMSWPQTIESVKGPIATLYRVIGWPSYFLIGPDGLIIVAAPNGEKIDIPGELEKQIPVSWQPEKRR